MTEAFKILLKVRPDIRETKAVTNSREPLLLPFLHTVLRGQHRSPRQDSGYSHSLPLKYSERQPAGNLWGRLVNTGN